MESADTTRKNCWSKKDTNKGGSKGKHKTKNATDAHTLDMRVASIWDAEVREFEWIKIGVDTVAGKTAWHQSVTCGKTILGESDLVFRTATCELMSNKQLYVDGCDDWRRVSEFLVFKHRCANRCCLLVSTRRRVESQSLYGNKGYMFHKGSTVAKKIDAWIQKELRDAR